MTVDELELLLGSWLDYWPWPSTWTGDLQRRATLPGPAPFQLIVCGTCAGRGRLRNKRVCHECKGLGRYEVDAYVGPLLAPAKPLPEPPTKLREERPRHGDQVLDSLTDQHERRDQLRVYAEIERVLGLVAPGVRWVIVWTYVLGGAPASAPAQRALAALAVVLRELRAPRWVRERLEQRRESIKRARGKQADRRVQQRRDAAIAEMRAAGVAPAAIGIELGISERRVYQVLKSNVTRADTSD